MSRHPAIFILILSMSTELLCSHAAFAWQDKESRQQAIQLPMAPEEPVFEFDIRGGMQMPISKDFKRSPKLQVFADGKIICGRPDPRFAEVVYQVSEQEVIELMEFLVNEHHLYDIDTEGIKKKIASSGARLMVADATTSHFRIALARGEHEFEVYAVDMVARQFTNIDELQSLIKIQDRLRYLINRAQMGTAERRDAIIETANVALLKESPKTAKVTMDDLQSASTNQDSKFTASFRRIDKDDKGNNTNSVSVTYVRPAKDVKPQVFVRIIPIGR